MTAPAWQDHLLFPRNGGPMDDADVEVEQENQVCGDRLRVWLRIRSDRVDRMTWSGQGCGPALAAASAASELVVNMTLDEVASLQREQIEHHLGGLPPRKGHAAALVSAALREAVEVFRRRCTMESRH